MALSPISGGPSILEIMKRPPSSSSAADAPQVEEPEVQINELNQAQEAADDMSMAATQFGRFRELNRKRSESSENVDRILDDDVDTKLDKIFEVLTSSKISKQKFNELLRSLFSDPSDLLLVLLELLRKKKVRKAQRAMLEELVEELEQSDDKGLIRAGINVALKARVFSESILKDPRMLRSLYREFIMFEGPTIYIYDDWIKQYNEEQREQLLDFMLQALICDMQSLAPSAINSAEFGPLLEKVGQVRVLYSVEESFITKVMTLLIARIKSPIKKDFLGIFVTGIIRHEDIVTELNKLLEVYSNLTLSMKAMLVQTLISAFSSLPTDIFLSQEMRDEMLESLREIMTGIYNEERRLERRRSSPIRE